MCGVAGSFNFINERLMQKMLKVTKHRGPDETNYYLDKKIMMGINRLAILDPKLGKQPMTCDNNDVVLVFNGEIFNYIEIKNYLLKNGCKFKTNNSDTEVILQAYKFFGLEFVKKLNGMFAIAIFDKRKETLYLIRDRVGIKPLFFSPCKNNILIFASEIKSILQTSFIEKKPNLYSIYNYFSLKNIAAPNTAFENIFQLRPGEILIKNKLSMKIKRFWDFKKQKNEKNISEKNIAKKIYSTLVKSVKLQMRSDVEVGSFLSGGLDSSAISVIASKFSKKKLKTFTIIYDDNIRKKIDDKIYARKISKMISSDHYELKINDKIIAQDLEKALNSFDQPFAGVISTYYLAKEVSKYVKVALSGDGADELFGSYLFPRISEPIRILKTNSIQIFQKKIKKFKEFQNKTNFLKKFQEKEYYEIRNKLFSFPDNLKNTILNKKIFNGEMNSNIEYFRQLFKIYKNNDVINQALMIDFKTLLPDQVLSFVDILSMAHSLEVRPPFMDNRMIDLSFSIPGKQKIKFSNVKYILKKSLENILPMDLIYRKKEGFVMPMEDLFLKKNIKYVRKIISIKNLKKHNFFENEKIIRMLDNIPNNNFLENNRIWIIFCFQIWWGKNFS